MITFKHLGRMKVLVKVITRAKSTASKVLPSLKKQVTPNILVLPVSMGEVKRYQSRFFLVKLAISFLTKASFSSDS